MAAILAFLMVFLAMAGYSSATYCICKDGVSNDLLQKDIDYACGDGADCNPIHETGPCYNPITVKDHCNYAVNSYFQRKGQVPGSCDFSGTAITSPTVPNAVNGCVYPSSPSTAGTGPATPTTPSTTAPATPGTTTNPPVTVTPGTNPGIAPPNTPTNPGNAPPGSTNPLIAPPGSTLPGSGGGANMPGFGGIGPSGINPDNTMGASPGISLHLGLTSLGSLVLSGLVFGLSRFGF